MSEFGLTTINFYEPTIFDKVSPLSAGAFSYYRFKLEGCYSEGNHLINKIKVIPKQAQSALWCPEICILWKISGASLRLNFLSV